MLKWKLMISTLPIVFAILAVKLFLGVVLGFEDLIAETVMVPFVSLIYLYMLRLIKDVDNPFDYEDGRRGLESGEVALFPLDEYRVRLAVRLAASAD